MVSCTLTNIVKTMKKFIIILVTTTDKTDVTLSVFSLIIICSLVVTLFPVVILGNRL